MPSAVATVAWSDAELRLLRSLALQSLPPLAPQPSNRVADRREAAELGQRIFFDPLFSPAEQVACATCHQPQLLFTDGRARSRGVADTARNAPTLVGVAHSPWLFWDGRRDSLWAQALSPFETAAEMGSTRVAVIRRVLSEPQLAEHYQRAFGSAAARDLLARLPEHAGPFGTAHQKAAWQRMSKRDRREVNQVFANIGKALAAYERLLQPAPSRFDRYVDSLGTGSTVDEDETLSELELQGLRLFIDSERTLCLRCHNGALFTNQGFHQVGTASRASPLPDFGRFLGLQAVLVDPFNCLGPFSDARPQQCTELRFLNKAHVAQEMGKFKTPTLRGLPRTAPYMHDGRFATLTEVIAHYRDPRASAASPELTPLELDPRESRALVAFLAALDGGIDAPERWLRPPPGTPPAARP